MTDPRLGLLAKHGVAAEQALDALARPSVIIRVGPRPSTSDLVAAVGLYAQCVRMFPNVELDADGYLPNNPWHATSVSDAVDLQPCVEPRCHPQPDPIVIGIGPAAGTADLYIGGDDWTAYLSTTPPACRAACYGGLGLHTATALAASEIFKNVLTHLGLTSNLLTNDFVWNLINYQLTPAPTTSTKPPQHQRLLFIGAGSLGSSAAAALCCTPVSATAEVVDPDYFDTSRNPYRYPAATVHTDGLKSKWVAQLLNMSAAINATPCTDQIEDWIHYQPQPGFNGTTIITVDRVDARRHTSDIWPRASIAAGVSGLATELLRSHIDDLDFACPYCLHVNVTDPGDQVDLYAQATGITTDRIQQLLAGEHLTLEDLKHVSIPDSTHLKGRRLEDLIRATYAEATIPTSDPTSSHLQISAPHVSWLTGITIAAEIIKASLALPTLKRRLRIDLRGLPLGVTDHPPADSTGRCICRDLFKRQEAQSWYERD